MAARLEPVHAHRAPRTQRFLTIRRKRWDWRRLAIPNAPSATATRTLGHAHVSRALVLAAAVLRTQRYDLTSAIDIQQSSLYFVYKG